MTIRLKCTCGEGMETDDQYAGQTAECLRCGKKIKIPLKKKPITLTRSDTGRHQGPASGRAITSMILGILGLTGMCILLGLPALILGKSELKAIKQKKSPIAGRGFAQAGFIMGIISTVISGLIILFYIGIIILAIIAGVYGK